MLRLSDPDRPTSIDKLNPFTIKGVAPAALEMFMFERLCSFAMDEPFAMYGLLAEMMLVAPDLSSLVFRNAIHTSSPAVSANVSRLRGR